MNNPLASLGRAFAGTISRRSFENPAYSLDDPALYEMFGGGIRSNAGVTVSRQAALSLSTMWRGVNLIADGVATLGLHRMVRTEGEGKQRDSQHPTYRLVNSRPNEYMTAYVFIKTLTAHAIFGNGYAFVERDRSGTARALLPLYPHCTYPVRENGRLLYVTQVSRLDGSSEQRKLEAGDVIHLKGLSYDGLCGYHLIDVLADTIGGALATRTHAVKFFKDGTLMSGVIEVPGQMDQKAQHALVQNWHKLYSGIDNAHRTALLTHGAKFSPMGMDADKAQLLESRVFDRVEIANVLGLPPHKLGDDSQVSYNSLESSERAVLKDSINPWLKAWETECDAKLLTEEEQAQQTHCYRFNRMAAIQSDSKTTAETLGLEFDKGLIVLDEAREKLGLGPLPNGLGRVILRPQSNLVPVSIDGEQSEDDLDFQREYVKALVADGTISDVMFNLTDAQALLEKVNIPVFQGYEEPWLPVIADNGKLVSGDVILDEDGEIVGGDVVDGDDTVDDDEAEDVADLRAALLRSAHNVMCKSLEQALIPVRNESKKAAQVPDEYLQRLEDAELKTGKAFDNITQAARANIEVLGGDTKAMKEKFILEIREWLLWAADDTAERLPERVARVMKMAERHLPRLAAMAVGTVFYGRGDKDGTAKPDPRDN